MQHTCVCMGEGVRAEDCVRVGSAPRVALREGVSDRRVMERKNAKEKEEKTRRKRKRVKTRRTSRKRSMSKKKEKKKKKQTDSGNTQAQGECHTETKVLKDAPRACRCRDRENLVQQSIYKRPSGVGWGDSGRRRRSKRRRR